MFRIEAVVTFDESYIYLLHNANIMAIMYYVTFGRDKPNVIVSAKRVFSRESFRFDYKESWRTVRWKKTKFKAAYFCESYYGLNLLNIPPLFMRQELVLDTN